MNKLIVGTISASMATAAMAGAAVVPLGTPLGRVLGVTLGQVLGIPLTSGGLLLVAALSLAVGIGIVRRKRSR
jgi:hypothetical protein